MLLATVASAQVRLYDPANDELAKKTRDAFAEFSKGDNSVFETMISNTLALKTATLAQLYDLNRQSVQDTVNLIPVRTWAQLLQRVERTQRQFLLDYNDAQQHILDKQIEVANDAAAALAAASARAERLQKEKNEKEDALEAAKKKLDGFKSSLQNIKDAVAASPKQVKKLSDVAEFQSLGKAWAGIEGLKDWYAAAEKESNTPGLQLTILDLGLQHEQMEIERLQLEIRQVDAAYKIANRIARRLKMVWGDDGAVDKNGHLRDGLFGEIYNYIVPCSGAKCPENGFVVENNKDEQVLVTAGKLATAANEEVGTQLRATLQLRNLIDTLEKYVALAGYQKYLLLADTIEAATDTHLFSIRRSALNTREREMLVSHGLEGLAAYYAGAVKPEEIANFFRAAQGAATAVLAGRVQ